MSGQLPTYLNLNMLRSDPRNKNAEKLSDQLKFKVADLKPHLHKITGQFSTGRKGWPV